MTLATIQAAKTRQQKALSAAFGGSFMIGSTVYQAAITEAAVSQVPAADGMGFRPVQQINIAVLKTLLATAPASGSSVTAKGKTWKVDSVAGQDATEVVWQITAVHFPKT
jgi:hypothetical protein